MPLFDRDSAERIGRAVRQVERRRGLGRGPGRSFLPQSPRTDFVQVTGALAAGYYPGTLAVWHDDTAAFVLEHDVWILSPSGVPVLDGVYYLCRLLGSVNDRPLYVTTGIAAIVEDDFPFVTVDPAAELRFNADRFALEQLASGIVTVDSLYVSGTILTALCTDHEAVISDYVSGVRVEKRIVNFPKNFGFVSATECVVDCVPAVPCPTAISFVKVNGCCRQFFPYLLTATVIQTGLPDFVIPLLYGGRRTQACWGGVNHPDVGVNSWNGRGVRPSDGSDITLDYTCCGEPYGRLFGDQGPGDTFGFHDVIPYDGMPTCDPLDVIFDVAEQPGPFKVQVTE